MGESLRNEKSEAADAASLWGNFANFELEWNIVFFLEIVHGRCGGTLR